MMLFDVTKKLALVMVCFTCSVIYILLQPRPCFTFREFELCFISRLRLKNGPVVLAFPMYHLTTALCFSIVHYVILRVLSGWGTDEEVKGSRRIKLVIWYFYHEEYRFCKKHC